MTATAPRPGQTDPHLPPGVSADELLAAQPDLDHRLASALERAGHGLRVLVWEQATRHGLSPIQVQLLLRLRVDPVERRRVGILAEEFDLSAATVSEALGALRRKGLIERHALEGDRRGQAMTLTDQGDQVAEELEHWPDSVTAHFADVPESAKAETLRVVLGLVAHLAESGTLTVARTCLTCRFFRADEHPEEARRHHCALLDRPLGDATLMVDCGEHEPKG